MLNELRIIIEQDKKTNEFRVTFEITDTEKNQDLVYNQLNEFLETEFLSATKIKTPEKLTIQFTTFDAEKVKLLKDGMKQMFLDSSVNYN